MNNTLTPWDGALSKRLIVVLSASGPMSSSLSLYQAPGKDAEVDDLLVAAMYGSGGYPGRSISAALVKVQYVPCYVNAGVWLYGKQKFNLKAMAMYGEVLEIINDSGALGECAGLLRLGEVIPLAVVVQRSTDKYRLINTSMHYYCHVVGRRMHVTHNESRSTTILRHHMLGFDPTIATMLNRDPMADIKALNKRIHKAWKDRMDDLKKSIRSTYR